VKNPRSPGRERGYRKRFLLVSLLVARKVSVNRLDFFGSAHCPASLADARADPVIVCRTGCIAARGHADRVFCSALACRIGLTCNGRPGPRRPAGSAVIVPVLWADIAHQTRRSHRFSYRHVIAQTAGLREERFTRITSWTPRTPDPVSSSIHQELLTGKISPGRLNNTGAVRVQIASDREGQATANIDNPEPCH
jgi:hypothetical protein